MSLERETSRGRFLKARLGVNGIQKAARSLGTSARTTGLGLATVVMGARSLEGCFGRRLVAADDASRSRSCPVGARFIRLRLDPAPANRRRAFFTAAKVSFAMAQRSHS